MNIELSEEQNDILRELKGLDPEQPFRGLQEISSQQSIEEDPQVFKGSANVDMFFEVDYDSQHEQLRQKLMNYRKQSQQIYQVGQLLKDYQSKFTKLMQDKDSLIVLLQSMKGGTSELVQKQKKMINLSMKLKQSLDYYQYHNKFTFDYPCEISCRQMYENILQQTLSQLTDGIQYFQENTTYSQSKKYLGMFQNSRSKMLSFVKSFFIKLFNKESAVMKKHVKISFNHLLETFYPKSKLKFISNYLLFFPQFATKLQHILKSVKESISEEDVKNLQMKEIQIYEFQLSRSNYALIGYLQHNMPQIYEQAILHFFTYYRTTFHQNFIKHQPKREGNLPQLFSQKYIQTLYLLSSQYAYMCSCCRVTSYDKGQMVRNTITSLSKMYFEELARIIKQARSKSPFQLCEIIMKISEDYPKFLDRHITQEYQSYVFGCVTDSINDEQHLSFLKSLFDTYSRKFLNDLEGLCFSMLPKFQIKNNKTQIEGQLKQFLNSISKLKFCEQYTQKYLIGALDSIVKSIKEANSKIQSRFECYLWNLELFCTIRGTLRGIRGNLVRKQLKFDTNNSSNIIERMKGVDRNQSLIKYAQDIFNVIKTGMPVINQLTLDFSKYINEHCDALETQFVKDIVYIYAKNMIEFLQKLAEATKISEEASREVCQSLNVKSLYTSYLLSLQKYVNDSLMLLKERDEYKFSDDTNELIQSLLNIVYEKLFDLLDKFYVQVSVHVSQTQKFKEIEVLKKMYKKSW